MCKEIYACASEMHHTWRSLYVPSLTHVCVRVRLHATQKNSKKLTIDDVHYSCIIEWNPEKTPILHFLCNAKPAR